MNYSIDLSDRLLCDLEMLLTGAFFPLKGFMNKKDYKSVVKNMRLSNGTIWPIPIVLPINEQTKNKIKHEEFVILRDSTNLPIAKLYIEDIYKPNINKECEKVYGTLDTNHPYVKIVKSYGNDVWYVGGKVKLINFPPHFDFNEDRYTPEQMKIFFAENKWENIIGFQTRNPMHRSHYELTKYAMKQTGINDIKLLIQPIVGVTQDDDIDYYTRVKCYKKILKYYPENTVKLCLLPLSMRMAGPREALLHAIIRKNYGCTHFIIGRDHAGPSNKKQNGQTFYGPYDAHELVKKYENEIGIKIILSKMIVYIKELNNYLPEDEVPNGLTIMTISGTKQRELLREGKPIPTWFTFPEIVEELRKTILPMNKRGFCVYFIGLPCSGKTTIARAIENKLKELTDRTITLLDGDIIRKNLSQGLGFSKEDRSINIRRIGFIASEIVKHRGIALCANIAPYEDDRKYNREIITKYGGYIEVFVNTPLDICEKRDVKGLYKLARQKIIKNFTGIDDPFEIPSNSEIILNDYNDLKKNINIILEKIKELGYI